MASMRKIAVIGALGVGALGLVGVGAGASFTDSVSAAQKVTAGTMNMQMSGPAGSTVSGDGKAVTFADTAPLGSTFHTTAQHATITNAGNINVNAWRLTFDYTSDNSAASAALAGELYAKVTSQDPNKGAQTLFDGKVSDLKGKSLSVTGPLAPGAQDDVALEFYAGTPDGVSSLNNDAEGGVITPTVTVDYIG